MCIHLGNPDRLALNAVALALEPPPPVDYLAWAENNITFKDGESPFPGPYNPAMFPEFTEILVALSPDDQCRIVTLAKSAQLGGTILANIFILGSIDLDPADLMYIHPTEDNAVRWSKRKLKPMLDGSPNLQRLFVSKSREGGDSILYKERRDGRAALLISGANSPASLSQVTMRRQVQDDLSKWEMNAAGDPETQADSRSRAHEFAKLFKISTPLVAPGCRITASYEAGSQERPFVPCPHCHHKQVLEWENLLTSIEADPENPHFTCTGCGCEIHEHDRPWMKARLEWRAANPKAKAYHRSFWIWSAYSVLQSWRLIAAEWLSARGDPGKEKTFFNDTLGLPYRAQGEAVPWEALRDRAATSPYAIGEIPAGALLITCGVDCQIDRAEWQVVGWGRDYRRWIIAAGVIPGHISEEGCRAKLDALLIQTWRNAAQRRLGLDLMAIDGNAWTEDVWGWVKKHPAAKVMMVRGVGSENAVLLALVKRERNNRTGKVLRYSKRFYNFATSVLKMGLYRNLAKEDPLEPGFVGLPRGLDDEFFRQLTAERRLPEKNRQGFTVYRWVKDPTQANEGLDTHLQAEAAAIRLGVRNLPDASWDKLAAERETPEVHVQGDLEDLMIGPAVIKAPVAGDPPPRKPGRITRRLA